MSTHDGTKPLAPRTSGEKWHRQFWPWFLIAIIGMGVLMSTITAAVAIYWRDVEMVRAEVQPLDKMSWQKQ